MKTASIITGRVRDSIKAINLIVELKSGKTRGIIDEIIFATWKGEVNSYPELVPFLIDAGVHVIEVPEQTSTFQESHQKIPLLIALSYLDDDFYVTRHRFDRVKLNQKFFNYIENIKIHGPKKVSIKWSPVNYKITVLSAALDLPFFINDLMFSGIKTDIERLVNINPLLQLHWASNINGELAFYANLFSDIFPIIYDYISTYAGPLFHHSELRRDIITKIQKQSSFFNEVLALYYFTINQCFDIGYATTMPAIIENASSLDSIVFQKSNIPNFGIHYFEELGHSYSKYNLFFNEFIDNKFTKSDYSDFILDKIDYFNNVTPRKITTPKITSPEAISYYNMLLNSGIILPPARGTSNYSDGFLNYNSSQLLNNSSALSRNTSTVNLSGWEEI